MTLKRKFDLDLGDALHVAKRQFKPSDSATMSDTDVAMSDASSPEPSPSSTHSDLPSPQYPYFQLYPENGPMGPSDSAIGLMQPNGFIHNSGTCTQIPKLRVACESGLGGRRTMWSLCEECGAIALIQ